MKKPFLRRPGPLFAALVLGALVVAFAFYTRPYRVMTPPSLLAPDEFVDVKRQSFGQVFIPRSGVPEVGLVFYPGARVPGESYAYLARAAARAGYAAVLLSLPMNFAVLAPSKALDAEKAYPSVRSWVVGGHSLGGAMAASFCASRQGDSRQGGKLGALLLLAAYPGGGADLSSSSLPVLSISASEDGLATPAKIAAARKLLPPSCRYVALGGGNHAQFGDYGPQPGDGTASLPADLQRKAVIEESLALLDKVRSGLN